MTTAAEVKRRNHKSALIIEAFRKRTFFTTLEVLEMLRANGYPMKLLGRTMGTNVLKDAGLRIAQKYKAGIIYSWWDIQTDADEETRIKEFERCKIELHLADTEEHEFFPKSSIFREGAKTVSKGEAKRRSATLSEVPKMCSLTALLRSIVFEPKDVKFRKNEEKY